MSIKKQIGSIRSWVAGIADSAKFGQPYTFAWDRAFDFRSNPSQLTVNPRAERQAAGIISDLPMWGVLALTQDYFYGNTGNVYLKDANNTWSVDHIVPNSVGNGMAYLAEDGYLYAAGSTSISRKFNATGSGTWYDAFLETEGGEPTNANSITLASASSQYASIADNASLSITLDISLEAYVKFASLPTSGNVQTLISKWNENSNQRSYRFDLTTSSNAFGDGSDGPLTIAADTTDAPIDSACTGTSGSYSLSATNVSFAAGQKILIIQTQGTTAGQFQETTIRSYSAGTITTVDALTADFSSGAQVLVGKQYTNITINSGKTWTAKAWNGTTGGILYCFANGTLSNAGTISAFACGFRGGAGHKKADGSSGIQGESYQGTGGAGRSPNLGGGGGGGILNTESGGGAGGSYGTAGANGSEGFGSGLIYGAADLTSLYLGSAGGGGFDNNNAATGGVGGTAGGMLVLQAATFTNTGSLSSNGDHGGFSTFEGGAGSGGSIRIKMQTGTLGSALITATGGAQAGSGGFGGNGIIAVYYATSETGTTSPSATIVQDTTLSNVSGYVLRLLLSSTGTNVETYTQDVTNIIQTGQWGRFAVTWNHLTSTASFYRNASLLGTQVGALVAIFNSTARFAIGTDYNSAGTARDFLNAQLDDVRVWNAVRSADDLLFYNDKVLSGAETNLVAYYRFEGTVTDSQTYTTASDLTATNTPTYSSDVPFSGFTTRTDQDVTINSTGSTYTLGTAISETSTNRRTFQPTKEPLKSIQLKINTVGTGNWTVVIHDGLNRLNNSVTVANANLHTGVYEFIFPSVSRPILTANYHVHVYSTVGDGIIVTSALNTMEGSSVTSTTTGAYLNTFYQILIDDSYHPMIQYQNFVAVGNERYVAKLEAGNLYNPHQLTLPAGYRVRSLTPFNEYLAIGTWRGSSITDTDQGKVFLWDGSSDVSGNSTPNYIIDVLEGGVNAMRGVGGVLNIIAGYKGKLLQYGAGGFSYAGPQSQKVKQLPNLANSEYCEVAPGAMEMWQSVLQIGGPLNTNSSTLHNGIYGYGRLNINYPDALGFDYPLSIGDQASSTVKIGCVFAQGTNLYVGYQNGNSYAIDKIAIANQPYSTATMELLINDLGDMTQLKQPITLRVDCEELTAGQSLTLKYKPDRKTAWNTLATQSTVGARSVSGTINELNREMQLALDVTCSTTSPTIYQISLETQTIPSPVNY